MEFETSRRSFLTAGLALPALTAAEAKPAGMAPRTLGKTGLKVTPLGFGGRGTSEPGVIARALDLGINFIDTGRMYQNNERMLGGVLKGRRKDVIIAGKTAAKTRQDALADLEASLRDLQTDYLDIWQLHGKVSPADVTDELLEALRAAKKSGQVRFVGITSHLNVPEMLADMLRRGVADAVLVGYNFTLRPEVTEAIRAARRKGMGIIAMKVLAGGFARIQNSAPRFEGSSDALVRTLRQDGAMAAAIRWALKNEAVDTSAVAMSDFDQVEDNVKAVSQPYSAGDEKLLRAKLAFLSPRYCRMCGACGGVCDKGVPVPDQLRFLTYAEGYRNFPLARQSFLELPESARRIRCSDCSSCGVQCPNGVEVRTRLIRAQELLARA
ncbi:MAG: aldo/keto reductase [Acidobacteria bacterium]|nr:aldo/keto reductase [Acidobacteriota bacterium]